jgi:hypothetical protein
MTRRCRGIYDIWTWKNAVRFALIAMAGGARGARVNIAFSATKRGMREMR